MSQIKSGQSWLTGAIDKHPLGDLAAASVLVQQLPTDDSIAALKQITAWLSDVCQIPDFSLQHTLDVVDLLDRLARNHQFKLVPEYLEPLRLKKLTESQLWTTSFQYWTVLGQAYLHCLYRFQRLEEGAPAFRHNLPLVVGRILRSLGVQLKWTLLRYVRVEERLWRELRRTYLFAESQGFATKRGAIYPDDHHESTPQEEFLKALMLYVAAPDALSPTQQHIAERIVMLFSRRFALHTTPGPGCMFAIDLSMQVPPNRARKGAGPASLVRFFGPGTVSEGLHGLSFHLQRHETLPVDANLGGSFTRAQVEPVLEHLARCWSDNPVPRRGKRQATHARLTVVPRFAEIFHWLTEIFEDESATTAEPAVSESWVVFDGSDGGFGAIVPALSGDWLSVGEMIAVRDEIAIHCRIGMLRRITSDEHGQRCVGVQVIGDVAIPVALFPGAARNAGDPTRAGEPAILITGQPDPHQAIELLFRPNRFVAGQTLQMRFRDRLHHIEYRSLLEAGKDYEWAGCRLIHLD